jgi:hypothetical protein
MLTQRKKDPNPQAAFTRRLFHIALIMLAMARGDAPSATTGNFTCSAMIHFGLLTNCLALEVAAIGAMS